MAKMFIANGTRVTASTFPTTAISAADLPKVVSADIFETKRHGPWDEVPEGSRKHLLFKAGQIVTQRQIDALFDPAAADTISPATGAAAGGTVVTIKGKNLDGVSGITFGGTAGTSLVIVSDTELRVTTPAKAAGASTVVLTDDSGTVTKAGFYTYV